MKLNNKSIALGAAIALASVSTSHALTTNKVYMTGSTACRTILGGALSANTAGLWDAAPLVTSYQGSSAAGSTYHIYEGNSTGPNGVGGYLILKTHWSGSEGGIADLNGTQETFLQDVGTGGVLFGDQHGTTPSGGQLTAPTTVQVAMADNSV